MKYEVTNEKKTVNGVTLKRIRAIAPIAALCVKIGDFGGWVESEKNLSQSGNAWVSGNAQVSGDARVSGDAQVFGDARVFDNARVSGNARVFDNARVSGVWQGSGL
jgi:carbonic anhydrase/acetyltransferase-like protein (isoleucine patch superfamily)